MINYEHYGKLTQVCAATILLSIEEIRRQAPKLPGDT
jgi:hypothetical protein